MIGHRVSSDAGDGYREVPADDAGDVAHGHAFLGHGVQDGARRRVLDRRPEDLGGIEAVHRGPAIGTVTRIPGDALFLATSMTRATKP